MAATHLIAVPNSAPRPESAGATAVETGAQRIRLLQEEARALARKEVDALAGDLCALAARAAEMAEGGDAYPPGVRELASRIEEDLIRQVKVLRAIVDRAARG